MRGEKYVWRDMHTDGVGLHGDDAAVKDGSWTEETFESHVISERPSSEAIEGKSWNDIVVNERFVSCLHGSALGDCSL